MRKPKQKTEKSLASAEKGSSQTLPGENEQSRTSKSIEVKQSNR